MIFLFIYYTFLADHEAYWVQSGEIFSELNWCVILFVGMKSMGV